MSVCLGKRLRFVASPEDGGPRTVGVNLGAQAGRRADRRSANASILDTPRNPLHPSAD